MDCGMCSHVPVWSFPAPVFLMCVSLCYTSLEIILLFWFLHAIGWYPTALLSAVSNNMHTQSASDDEEHIKVILSELDNQWQVTRLSVQRSDRLHS